MINENHYAPNHRMLVYLMLNELYAKGFRYLALEALWDSESELKERQFCTTYSGFYTREPIMNSLVDYALALGYSVFGYDDLSQGAHTDLETKQAQNIFNATLKGDPSAKVIVLAGDTHIDERQNERLVNNAMAAQFNVLYGIDPLTINQTKFYGVMDKHRIGIVDSPYFEEEADEIKPADIYISNNLTKNNSIP